jgi:hypothetical protein
VQQEQQEQDHHQQQRDASPSAEAVADAAALGDTDLGALELLRAYSLASDVEDSQHTDSVDQAHGAAADDADSGEEAAAAGDGESGDVAEGGVVYGPQLPSDVEQQQQGAEAAWEAEEGAAETAVEYGPALPPAADAAAAQQEAAAAAAAGGRELSSSAAAAGDAEGGQSAAAAGAGAGAAGAPPAAMCAIIEKLLAFMEKHGASFEVRAVLGHSFLWAYMAPMPGVCSICYMQQAVGKLNFELVHKPTTCLVLRCTETCMLAVLIGSYPANARLVIHKVQAIGTLLV